MPAKQSAGASRSGQQAGSSRRQPSYDSEEGSSDPFESEEEREDTTRRQSGQRAQQQQQQQQPSGGAGAEKTIPKNLLTRVLHEFFEKDATRVSRDANAAVGKYIDTFVREAIARAAVEKRSGFLEVS